MFFFPFNFYIFRVRHWIRNRTNFHTQIRTTISLPLSKNTRNILNCDFVNGKRCFEKLFWVHIKVTFYYALPPPQGNHLLVVYGYWKGSRHLCYSSLGVIVLKMRCINSYDQLKNIDWWSRVGFSTTSAQHLPVKGNDKHCHGLAMASKFCQW